jgi:hypothetical protein
MINVADTISILFAAVDPYTWRKYRDVYVRMASEFRLVEECDPDRIQCFVGHYTLINMLTTPRFFFNTIGQAWNNLAAIRYGEISFRK